MCLIVNVLACVVDLVGCVVLVGWVNRCKKGILVDLIVVVDGVIIVVGTIVVQRKDILKHFKGQ